MKKTLFLVAVIFISMTIHAQVRTDYKTANLAPYEGTWVYQNQDTIFKINLERTFWKSRSLQKRILMGGYSLSIGDSIVQNYICTNFPDTVDTKLILNSYIYCARYSYTDTIKYKHPNVLEIDLKDAKIKHIISPESGKQLSLYAGKIHWIAPDTIRWVLNEEEGMMFEELPFKNLGFSVPTNAIMIKEK